MNRAKKQMKKRIPKPKITVGISQSDIKSFLEKFKADVARKAKEYQDYAQESQKKKKL